MSLIVKKLSDYVSLASAVAAIGSEITQLIIDKADSMAGNISIPATLHCVFVSGGVITTTGYTLTFGAAPEIGFTQAFSGTGTVVGLNEARPELWAINTTPGTTDMTTAIQAAVNASSNVSITCPYEYKTTDEILLNSNQCITMSSGVTIHQYTANKNIFKATSKDNVWIHANGAILYGEGTWSSGWTDVYGHEDRAIQFLGCTNSGVIMPHIKNCGAAGIAIMGGSGIRVIAPIIEGTNLYSTVIPYTGNHQHGIMLSNHTTYGDGDDIIIIAPDISGTCQGIIRIAQTAVAAGDGTVQIINPTIHDITGQHAVYLQEGHVSISNPALYNIALAGIKIQSGGANLAVRAVSATGVTAYHLGSNIFEVAVVGSGSVSELLLSATGDDVGTGLSVLGDCSNIKCDMVLRNVIGNAFLAQGVGPHDIDCTFTAENLGGDGVFVSATTATGLKIRPKIIDPNYTPLTYAAGVHINSASAVIELFDPVITDSAANMNYGIWNEADGSLIYVRGSVKIAGATSVAYKGHSNGTGIMEWPAEAVLNTTADGQILGNADIKSSQAVTTICQSTSITPVVLWSQQLADESAYLCTAQIVGKLSGSAQRAGYITSVLVYRNGGNATIEGTPDVLSYVSASFAGVEAWNIDTNGIYLKVHSGGTAVYDWKAVVTVVPVV